MAASRLKLVFGDGVQTFCSMHVAAQTFAGADVRFHTIRLSTLYIISYGECTGRSAKKARNTSRIIQLQICFLAGKGVSRVKATGRSETELH